MDTALDDVAFLANSENRVTVFEVLVEAPRERAEVTDRVDASRVTVARILRELEGRNWITRSGREYAVTPLGEWVYDEFAGLVEEVEAERRLRDALQWFPPDLLTFDVRCLRGAEIVRLDESDMTAMLRRVVEFQRSGDRVRGVARESAPEAVRNQWELTVRGDTQVELVVTPDIVDAIRNHPPSARRLVEMLEEENARYLVHESIPMSVAIVDGRVGFNLTDETGVLKGGLITGADTVHAWAVDLFESYRSKARPLPPDEITA
jgi:predicted transcriptional regulator